MVRLRARIADHRASAGDTVSPDPSSSSSTPLADVDSAIAAARGLADLSSAPYSTLRGGRLKRNLGRISSKIVRALVRNVVGQQTQFNRAVVESLEAMRRTLEVEDTASSQSGNCGDLPAPRQAAATRSSLFRALEFSKRFKSESGEPASREQRYAELFVGAEHVLDVACGSGRFLQACAQQGLPARGVDLDAAMIASCREKGLDVELDDAFAHLAQLDDVSLSGVFSAQFVEHLAPQQLMHFVELIHRKLEPGGRTVIETLNPECLQVIYRWFWLDPTHRRLVHPWLLEELLCTAGFSNVEIHLVPPPADAPRIPHLPTETPADVETNAEFNAATNHLNELIYSSTDYYVVATK